MNKMQLRQRVQLDAHPQLAAQEPGRLIEAGLRLLKFVSRCKRREKHLGMRVVRRDLNFGQRHHADTGILDFLPNQLRQLALDLVVDAKRTAEVFRHNEYYSENKSEVEREGERAAKRDSTSSTARRRAAMPTKLYDDLESELGERPCDFLYLEHF